MNFKQACKLDNNQAREHLEKLRWGGEPYCPHCGCLEVTKLQGKSTRPGVHKCKSKACRKQFTVTVGTIFEDSHIELRHWVMAFSLVCSSKKGISALQLQRMLGLGSYKSAWHLAHRIRWAMQNEPMQTILKGTIEMDETYVGGKPPRVPRVKYDLKPGENPPLPRRFGGPGEKLNTGRGTKKTPVAALIERDGKMRTKVLGRVDAKSLRAAVAERVDTEQSRLMSDEFQPYKNVGRMFKLAHDSVCHSAGEYSRDGVHVNSCESFFALLKRGVHGTFHHVSKQHLQRYADEFAFRWNHRKITDAERTEAALMMAPNCRLQYKNRAC